MPECHLYVMFTPKSIPVPGWTQSESKELDGTRSVVSIGLRLDPASTLCLVCSTLGVKLLHRILLNLR